MFSFTFFDVLTETWTQDLLIYLCRVLRMLNGPCCSRPSDISNKLWPTGSISGQVQLGVLQFISTRMPSDLVVPFDNSVLQKCITNISREFKATYSACVN